MELKRVFAKGASQMGYAKLKPKLEEVVSHFVNGNGNDVFFPHSKWKVLAL